MKKNNKTGVSKKSGSSSSSTSNTSLPKTIAIATNDARIFDVELEVARLFGIVNNLISYGFFDKDVGPVPLPMVSGETFELVLTWAREYVKNPRDPKTMIALNYSGENRHDQSADAGLPLKERTMFDLETWEFEFFGNLSSKKMTNLLNAANYLELIPLLDSCCKDVAQSIKSAMEVGGAQEVANSVIDFSKETPLCDSCKVKKENIEEDE